MKTIVVELTKEEAEWASDSLRHASNYRDSIINDSAYDPTKNNREQLINQRNLMENARNKINRALGVPKETK